MLHRYFSILFIAILTINIQAQDAPNILLVIADDLGVDHLRAYHDRNLMAITPTLDSLRANGISFENVFATPKCTPSRASIMSGKYGINTEVIGVPGNLDLNHTTIFQALSDETDEAYSQALIGKWHLTENPSGQDPIDRGVDYFMGVLSSGVSSGGGDYYNWTKTENGINSQETEYVTTVFTDKSINWVNQQNKPWFLWLAHVAPHSPFHTPPDHMYSVSNPNNNLRQYIAMIESIDYELNRFLNSLSAEEKENTIIIFLGDNGTPNQVLQDYPSGHGKSSLYQGGLRVPLIISGAQVTRKGERESALVHITDLYATILELTGSELDGGIYNSQSFKHLLSNESGPTRTYNYSEINKETDNGHVIRNEEYKLIQFDDKEDEFYNLIKDSFELDNIINSLTTQELIIKADLEAEAAQIRTAWSCRDHILNGDEEGIDCGGTYCAPCISSILDDNLSNSTIDIFPNPTTDQLDVMCSYGILKKLKVFNTQGKMLYSASDINLHQYKLDTSKLAAGVYWLEVLCASKTALLKFVKQ